MRHSLMRALAALCTLLPLASCGLAADGAPRAVFVGTTVWPEAAHGLGGFSGLEISADGLSFTAISDRGHVVQGHFARDTGKTARINGISLTSAAPLADENGAPLKSLFADAEGLALGADDALFLSFEGKHRVDRLTTNGRTTSLPRAKAFAKLQNNSGFEALAIDDKGRLLAIPERSGQLTRPFPVWRLENGAWRVAFELPRRGGFLPVGADVGPDGRLYLLEREFTGFAFKSRVRRFALTDTGITSEETVLLSGPLRHDNLEGIAVWQDDSHALRLTMVSDDNFNALQSTQFVEYRLP